MSVTDSLPSRAVVLLATVYTVVLMVFVRGYHPTDPAHCELMLVYYASYLLILALLLSPKTRRVLNRPVIRWGVYPTAHLPVAYAVGEYVGTSLLVSHMLAPSATRLVVGVQFVLFIAVCLAGIRVSRLREAMRVVAITGIFLNAILFVPICAFLWAPPSPQACEAAAEHPGVTRLTPQRFADNLSYPYEVHHLGDGVIAGSFKMAGNTVLQFWDKPESNRVVVVDTKAPEESAMRVLELPGQGLPEHMAYHPERRELAVKLVGFHEREVIIVGLDDGTQLSVRRRLKTPFIPHALALSADGQELFVFSVDLTLNRYGWEDLKPRGAQQLTLPKTIMLLNQTRRPGTDTFFLSSFGPKISSFDARTGRQGTGDVGFAGGDLTLLTDKSLVVQTDLLNHRVNVVDAISLSLLKQLDVPFSPRAVAADESTGQLFVGDWFGGEVHTLGIDDLEPRSPPIFVGPYLRKFAFDPNRRVLYTASKCGLMAVRTDLEDP